MVAIGQLALRQGDDAAAAAMAGGALPALERAGDERLRASALKTLAIAAQRRGDHEESLRLSDQVIAIHRELGNTHGVANELGNQGYQALVTRDDDRAESLLREALAVIDRDASEYDLHLSNLGLALCLQGRVEEASAAFHDALASAWRRDDRESVSFGLEGLATVAALAGDDLRAARLWGAAEALFERMGYSMPLVERGLHDELVPASRKRAGEGPFDQAWADAKLLPEERAVQLALAG
jgi:tetratricopeptide (TPR) repeat protein